jgi:hypothetical protein
MKFKLKAAVAALAMVAAGGANAAINPGLNESGELYFSVFDSVNQISYTRDLGVTVSDFLADPTAPMSFAADATLSSFITTANASGSSLVWNLMGALDTDFGTPSDYPVYGLYSTSKSGDASVAATNWNQMSGALQSVAAYANGTNGGLTSYAANDSTTWTDGSAYYPGLNGGNNFGAKVSFSDEAAIGESMAFYHLGIELDANGELVFDNTDSFIMSTEKFGDWELATDGTLTYVTPIPPAILLLGSALMGLVGVARRRQQDEGLAA